MSFEITLAKSQMLLSSNIFDLAFRLGPVVSRPADAQRSDGMALFFNAAINVSRFSRSRVTCVSGGKVMKPT